MDVMCTESKVFLKETLLWRGTLRPETVGSHLSLRRHKPGGKKKSFFMCLCRDYYIYGSLFL